MSALVTPAKTARTTVAQVSARVDALESQVSAMADTLSRIEVLLTAQAPAKVTTPAPARKKASTPRKAVAKKAPAKVAKTAPAPKSAQTRETLSRKDWNRTLTTKARFAGGDAYKRVTAAWDLATQYRNAGATPEEAMTAILASNA